MKSEKNPLKKIMPIFQKYLLDLVEKNPTYYQISSGLQSTIFEEKKIINKSATEIEKITTATREKLQSEYYCKIFLTMHISSFATIHDKNIKSKQIMINFLQSHITDDNLTTLMEEIKKTAKHNFTRSYGNEHYLKIYLTLQNTCNFWNFFIINNTVAKDLVDVSALETFKNKNIIVNLAQKFKDDQKEIFMDNLFSKANASQKEVLHEIEKEIFSKIRVMLRLKKRGDNKAPCVDESAFNLLSFINLPQQEEVHQLVHNYEIKLSDIHNLGVGKLFTIKDFGSMTKESNVIGGGAHFTVSVRNNGFTITIQTDTRNSSMIDTYEKSVNLLIVNIIKKMEDGIKNNEKLNDDELSFRLMLRKQKVENMNEYLLLIKEHNLNQKLLANKPINTSIPKRKI